MVLLKGINFMRFNLVLLFLSTYSICCHAETHNNNTIKSMIVQGIMKKISNITLNTLSQAAPEKKETILNKIENKLKKSAKAMGSDADKYVKFIMDEFKTKAFVRKEPPKNVSEVLRKSINLRTEQTTKTRTVMDAKTRQEIIKDIANKIQTLAKGFTKNAPTLEVKKHILEKIKKRIMESTRRKHSELHSKHEELKTYSSLIAQGLEVSMRKMLTEDISGRRMNSATDREIIINDTGLDKPNNDTYEEDIKKTMVVMDLGEINKYKDLITNSLNESSIDPRCEEIVEETCLAIQAFNKIPCGEGKTVPIENLCNGVIDCENQVDELNCTAQAMEKVRKATAVMTDIEASLSRKCFAASGGDGHILTSQNQILRDVLKTQMDFLEKHVKAPLQETENKEKSTDTVDELFIKRTVTDVSVILSTLSYALDGTLCAHTVDPEHPGNHAARKYNDIEVDELDDTQIDPHFNAKLCTCKGQFCKDMTCVPPCKRVCWQRYSLSHWGCQATNGGTSVSLNVVCDGKLDCFDETDEIQCVADTKLSKFEAVRTYSDLLDLLTTKSKSHEFMHARNKLTALHGLVRQLQKHTIKTNHDVHTIKSLRDESFLLLVSIYDDLVQTQRLEELEDRYLVLLSINEKLVTALKRSHTGNEVLISPEGCYCRDGLCALRRCNRNCIQACLAEPLLTRYPCNDSSNNTVSIDTVCNGKKNCPNGEDEKDCVKGVCRAHHLVVLRHNLQNVAVKHESTVLGEVLESWKTKVSAALFIAETSERPNHIILTDIIAKVLRDLVMAFAAMEDYRRINSEYALKEFIGVSKIVMDTLKSCSN